MASDLKSDLVKYDDAPTMSLCQADGQSSCTYVLSSWIKFKYILTALILSQKQNLNTNMGKYYCTLG